MYVHECVDNYFVCVPVAAGDGWHSPLAPLSASRAARLARDVSRRVARLDVAWMDQVIILLIF